MAVIELGQEVQAAYARDSALRKGLDRP